MELELYNGQYCITGTALIISEDNPEGMVSKPMYDKMRRQYPDMVARRANGKLPSLIYPSKLPTKYRVMAEQRYPNLLAQREAKPLIEKIENDPAAVDYFAKEFRLPGDVALPKEAQTEYVNNARLLNMFRNELIECRIANAQHGKSVNKAGFWNNMAGKLKRFADVCPNTLPENPRRLRQKYEEYVAQGYRALVHNRYLNQNSTKITEEVGDWLIARFAANINRVTITQLHEEYNRVAPDNGWKPIKTPKSIRNYLYDSEIKPLWYEARYGSTVAKEAFSRQHRTLLPTMRDSLWYSDGTKLNYFFRNENGKLSTCNVYEVMDVYSEVLLGFHISPTENYEAQFNAYKMAMQTSRCKPYEIVFDNQGGHKKLKDSFFANLTRVVRSTAPYNGKSKTIENAFKRFQESYLHKDPFFTGQNITTNKRESSVNMEWILANVANLPTLDEVKKIYAQRRQEWNNAPHPKTGRPRIEMYRTSINPNVLPVDVLDIVELFYIQAKDPITYRQSGIQITVKGIKYAYEVLTSDGKPDDKFRITNIGRKFIVKYDPDDMEMLALFEDTHKGLRFITYAQTYIYVHRAKQDQEDDEAAFLKAREMADKAERLQRSRDNDARLERHGLLPEQHGYRTPKVRGVNKKEEERFDLGTYTKAVSNAMPEELLDVIDEKVPTPVDIY